MKEKNRLNHGFEELMDCTDSISLKSINPNTSVPSASSVSIRDSDNRQASVYLSKSEN